MSAKPHSPWLLSTVNAVRELMIQRLEKNSLDPDAQREVQMALEELDVMWEELQGQAEILLREHQRYAEFFEFAPDAYLVTDAGGNIREANQAARELLAQESLTGRPLAQFVAEGDRVSFLSLLVGTQARTASGVMLQPARGGALRCEFAVRAIPLAKSGVSGLCWLIRPA